MKKFFIIAAAVAATVACAKVETVNGNFDKKVTFQAANYVPSSRAGEVSVLNDFDAFKCKAYLHAEGVDLNADGTVNGTSYQNFFGASGETISYDGSSEWAPSHTYYWPKGAKSFVNFIGWYGTDGTNDVDPTISYAYASGKYKATMTWNFTSVAGEAGSNLLYADMAWRYKQNNDPATYGLDGVTEGVPMLFHHALAQINVKVYADSSLTAGSGTVSNDVATWTLAIKNAAITPVYNAGTLTLTNEDPGTNKTQAWTGDWTATGTADSLKRGSVLNVSKVSKATADTLFNATCVVPQTIGTDVVLSFDLDITVTYNDDPANPNHEILPQSIKLNDMGTSAWQQNHKYTYYLKVLPSKKVVLFDPALEADWVEEEGPVQEI